MKLTQVKPGDGRLIGGRFYSLGENTPKQDIMLVGFGGERMR